MAATSFKPLSTVLIKPAGPDCNLNCSYCFYKEKNSLFPESSVHRMSDEILEELISQVIAQSDDDVSFSWQGGEPTLAGLSFYRKVMLLQEKYGRKKTIGNGLQTNGLLLNEEWATFLKNNAWLVGLSIDGPQHIHDRFRTDKGENPTHSRVETIAQMLLEKGVETNAMCCITNYSAQYAEDIYLYFKELGFKWMQFIPVVERDPDNPLKAAPFSVTAEAYGHFLIKLFDLWISDFKDGFPTTSIREFESIFYTYVGLQAPECTLMKQCGVYTVVEHNGNCYCCDFFVDPNYLLGNVLQDRLIDMLNSKKQQQFGEVKSCLPPKCKSCKWYSHCFGGCIKDRIKDPADQMMPRFCLSTKMFLNYADGEFRKLANRWMQSPINKQFIKNGGGIYDATDQFF